VGIYTGGYVYSVSDNLDLHGVLGEGGRWKDLRNDISRVFYSGECCMKKECCTGGAANVKLMCRIHIEIKDRYMFGEDDAHAWVDKLGVNYYTKIHFYKTLDDSFSTSCK